MYSKKNACGCASFLKLPHLLFSKLARDTHHCEHSMPRKEKCKMTGQQTLWFILTSLQYIGGSTVSTLLSASAAPRTSKSVTFAYRGSLESCQSFLQVKYLHGIWYLWLLLKFNGIYSKYCSVHQPYYEANVLVTLPFLVNCRDKLFCTYMGFQVHAPIAKSARNYALKS